VFQTFPSQILSKNMESMFNLTLGKIVRKYWDFIFYFSQNFPIFSQNGRIILPFWEKRKTWGKIQHFPMILGVSDDVVMDMSSVQLALFHYIVGEWFDPLQFSPISWHLHLPHLHFFIHTPSITFAWHP